jgi:hypothetical protein
MATSPMAAYRGADESQTPFRINVVGPIPRVEQKTPDTDSEAGRGAAQGIVVALFLCVPFWVGVYVMLS